MIAHPPEWPSVAKDEADRILRRLSDVVRASLGELEVGQERIGRRFDWQSAEAQAWILDRIRARLFQR